MILSFVWNHLIPSGNRNHSNRRNNPKQAYSFTDDLKLYETCPRQCQFFREYDFAPSRSAVIFFGR